MTKPSCALRALRPVVLFALSLPVACLLWSALRAQDSTPNPYDAKAHYRKQEFMISMRDGVKLYTAVYLPLKQEPAPFLLFRTVYGVGAYGPDQFAHQMGLSDQSHSIEDEGFIFVRQDVRGKFRSEGAFGTMRPILAERHGTQTDESTDTYDTIEWLLKNVSGHNGRVGLWGISASATQVLYGMISPHPAIRAASPQAPAVDMFIGDDFHHNGAFRLSYTFFWLSRNARVRSGPSDSEGRPFDMGTPDQYRFYLDMGPLRNANARYLHDQVPLWNQYMEHGSYDEFWSSRNMLRHLVKIPFPVLTVASWFDAEDFYGPMSVYRQLKTTSPDARRYLFVGAFEHGGWNEHPDGNSLGNLRFQGDPAVFFREKVQLPFFRHYLKDKGPLDLPPVLAYETGVNEWRNMTEWPPQTTEKRLFLRENHGLSFDPPTQAGVAYDEYVSDPDHPVPFTVEVRRNPGQLWMVEDQRFAATRPDVLAYESEPLAEDLVVAGPLTAQLVVSTSGTDADYIVKLIDVYPGNAPNDSPRACGPPMGHYQLMLSAEVLRAKFRESFVKPEPMKPGVPTGLTIHLPERLHRFRKGHRLMVQIQSTWFPIIDRNPQQFVDVYSAKEADFQKAAQRVYRSGDHPSYLTLPLLTDGNSASGGGH